METITKSFTIPSILSRKGYIERACNCFNIIFAKRFLSIKSLESNLVFTTLVLNAL